MVNLHDTAYGRLLDIFIGGTSEEYSKFKADSDLKEMGFTEPQIQILEEKMKLLTLVALACQSPDVLYR